MKKFFFILAFSLPFSIGADDRSLINKALIASSLGVVGSGCYLYSNYKPAPLSDHYHQLDDQDETGPITIFVHGYEDTYRQAYQYVKTITTPEQTYDNKHSTITTPSLVTFNFADAGKEKLRINRKETSMAQESEIERLRIILEKTKKEHPGREIVLMGLSRGASTIINFLAQYPNTKIKAALLESPFGHVEDVIRNIIHKLGMGNIPGIYTIGMALAQCFFSKFKRDGIHSIDVVDKLPQDLPILITSSLQDQLVPTSSSKALYDKLRATGHSNTHLLTVAHGKHSKIISGQDGQRYKDTAHAFYKKYTLPHDQTLAKRGAQYLIS